MSTSTTRVVAATLLAASAAALITPASAGASTASSKVTFQCQASAAGQKKETPLDVNLTGDAPASVKAGAEFTEKVIPQSGTLPAKVGDLKINDIHDAKFYLPIPEHATYVDATQSGGSGLGDGKVSISFDKAKNRVALTVPGKILGGTDFTLPTVTLKLKAGDSGTIEQTLAGTSYDDPGLTVVGNVQGPVGDVNGDVACYPKPNPVLSSTKIG